MKLTACSVYLQDEKASFDVIDNDTIPTPANKSYPLYGWVIINLSNRPYYFLFSSLRSQLFTIGTNPSKKQNINFFAALNWLTNILIIQPANQEVTQITDKKDV